MNSGPQPYAASTVFAGPPRWPSFIIIMAVWLLCVVGAPTCGTQKATLWGSLRHLYVSSRHGTQVSMLLRQEPLLPEPTVCRTKCLASGTHFLVNSTFLPVCHCRFCLQCLCRAHALRASSSVCLMLLRGR